MIYKLEIAFNPKPFSKIVQLGDREFEFRFQYNTKEDSISLEVYEENELKHTTKLIYGVDIFKHTGLCSFPVVPYSESNFNLDFLLGLRVGKETFGKVVFLMYDV